jgi:probable HAF family extracellular repeat protein
MNDFPDGLYTSKASGVSADGSIVVGFEGREDLNEAFRWTSADGMVGIGDLSGSIIDSIAEGTSADGSVVVGSGDSSSGGGGEAFRWTSEGGMVGLGDLEGGRFWSFAFAVSADGNVVVGRSESSTDLWEAYRWTKEGGMIGNARKRTPLGEFRLALSRLQLRWTSLANSRFRPCPIVLSMDPLPFQ